MKIMKSIFLSVKSKVVLISLASVFLLAGCSGNTGRGAVESFVKKDLGLKNFEISSEPEEYAGEDSFKDKIWKVTDLDRGFSFEVIEDTYYSVEARRKRIVSNYDARFVSEYDKSLPEGVKVSYSFESDDEIIIPKLYGSFRNRSELDGLMEDLKTVYSYYKEIEFDSSRICFVFHYDFPLVENVTFYQDYPSVGGMLEDCLMAKEDLYDDLIMTCVDHRYFEGLEGFSESEIDSFLKKNKDVRPLFQEGTELEGIIASEYGYGVSFGSLYEVLKMNGFDIRGDSRDYSFTGIDGSEYEISYGFNDYPFDNEGHEDFGYYYLKDGEKIPMDHSFYNHFRFGKVEEMTGLELSDSQ